MNRDWLETQSLDFCSTKTNKSLFLMRKVGRKKGKEAGRGEGERNGRREGRRKRQKKEGKKLARHNLRAGQSER